MTYHTCFLVLTTVLCWAQTLTLWNGLSRLNRNLLRLTCGYQTLNLLDRWLTTGNFPLSNLYESLSFLSWALTTFVVLVQLDLSWLTSRVDAVLHTRVVERVSILRMPYLLDADAMALPTPVDGAPRRGLNRVVNALYHDLLGSLLIPVIALVNGFANSLPDGFKAPSRLVPALQSHWLQMHVVVMIAAYALLLIGGLFSVAYLVMSHGLFDAPVSADDYRDPGGSVDEHTLGRERQRRARLETYAQVMDNQSYRTIGLGFPLLTMGLLSGAVWANQTWGAYWSWDPKETWALITWFVFATYLHTRLSAGWTGRKSALVASFGFATIWVCYLGVNLMAKGLHSYGFLR